MLNKTMARIQCEDYCGKIKNCNGCTHTCNVTCGWNAYTIVDNEAVFQTILGEERSVKPSKRNPSINYSLGQNHIDI